MKYPVRIATITVAVALLSACAPEAKPDPAVEALRAAAESNSQMTAALATLIIALTVLFIGGDADHGRG